MKKFYMTMVAMLCGVAAMAQNTLTAEDMKVETGATAADLVIGLDNTDPIVAVSFRLALPDGVKAKAAKYITINEDRIDMDAVRAAADDEDAEVTDVYTIMIQNASDGNKMYSFYPSSSISLLGNTGTILTIPLTLTDVADASYEVKLYAISLGNAQGVSVADAEEITCTLQVGEGTGINSINAADSKAPVYNVAGQRVSKAQKGVYIQNGKKIAVK
jgi:hypothetical protein